MIVHAQQHKNNFKYAGLWSVAASTATALPCPAFAALRASDQKYPRQDRFATGGCAVLC